MCTRFEHAPETASRPFDRDRGGMVPSEGAGTLFLEVCQYVCFPKS